MMGESALDALLKKEFKPKTSGAQEAIERAVKTLAEQALAGVATVSDDSIKSIEAIIAALDRKLSEQCNAILHHADFQAHESSWRGIAHLVNNTETDETLKIRVLNISKKDLGKTIAKFKEKDANGNGKADMREGKDVAHMKALSKGGSNKNGVRVESASANRSFKRGSNHKVVSEISARERKKK